MKAIPFANSNESFRSWTQFAQEDLIKEDLSILLWCLEKTAEAALEILQADPSIENKSVFWQCQRRYESLLQDLGDVYFLYMSKLFTGVFCAAHILHRTSCSNALKMNTINDHDGNLRYEESHAELEELI